MMRLPWVVPKYSDGGGLSRRVLRVLALPVISAVGLIAQAFRASRRAVVLTPPDGGAAEFGDTNLPRLRFTVIGDSTSVGIGATSIDRTYPWLIAKHLAEHFRVSLNVFGRGGARMRDAADGFARSAAGLHPDLVLVGLGANDVTHLTPLPRFSRELSLVIATLSGAGAQVVIALGPRFDAPALPRPLRDFVRARARALNRTIERVASRHEVEVLDLPGRIGSAFARDHSLYADDGFHPSDSGYALWADVMKDQVLAAARKTSRDEPRPG